MAEYVERDEAVRKALEGCVKVVGHGITQIEAVDIADIIDSIPTADVVPVVRCKDCEHFNKYNPDRAYCEEHSDDWGDNIVYVNEDDYCSYGERRCDNER